jgi:hypothetical protein
MIAVCPLPIAWNDLYVALCAVAEARQLSAPPVPFILSGWAYSNDAEKRARWQQTVEWATRHEVGPLLQRVAAHDMYQVEALSTYRVGPIGGPLLLEWTFDPKPRVERAHREAAIERLRSHWHEIADDQLSRVTQPLRLTGAKGRRLLVRAQATASPPWGSWTTLLAGEERRSFSRFRAAINAALAPLVVDHIDFEIADTL